MCAGLLYGDFSQFIMQAIDAGIVVDFGFVMAFVWFKVSDLITPIRVSKEVEIEGLDGPEMGVLGYPDFQLHPSGMGITMVGVSAVASKTAETARGQSSCGTELIERSKSNVSERRPRDGEEE